MEFDWYNIINREEIPEGLISREVTYNLAGIGERTILITKGVEFAITYDGVFLPTLFMGKNPYYREGYAVWVDENQNVWLGVEKEE